MNQHLCDIYIIIDEVKSQINLIAMNLHMTYIINQLGISLFLLRIAMIASSCLSCSS